MEKKMMYFNQVAQCYGIDPRTFMKDLQSRDGIMEELEQSLWDGRKFYPKQIEIIEKYFGKIPLPEKTTKQ